MTAFLREFHSKLSPFAFGMDLRFQSAGSTLIARVELSWRCYYRIFPEYAEQLAFERGVPLSEILAGQGLEGDGNSPSDDDDEDAEAGLLPSSGIQRTAAPPRGATDRAGKFLPKFRRIDCSATGHIKLGLSDGDRWEIDSSHLEDAIQREIERAKKAVHDHPLGFRVRDEPHSRVRVTRGNLETPETYDSFLQTLKSTVVPDWNWELRVQVRKEISNPDWVFSLQAVNSSNTEDDDPNEEGFFFDVKIRTGLDGGIPLPFELELAPKSFRYNREVWGRGFNCGVSRIPRMENGVDFETVNAPRVEQLRYSTRTTPPARFRELATDQTPVLRQILSAMKEYRAVWSKARTDYASQDPAWNARHGPEFDVDAAKFDEEISRFERGVSLVEIDPDVALAFRLTNEAFALDIEKDSWRLFQIVFIVSQIPGIHALKSRDLRASEDRKVVDILYFPTGGGKTEAYLGVIVFHCFFDRLRGKTAGVTAWTRFPLRLLTVQQTQRFMDVMGRAELIRARHAEPRLSGPTVDGFAVGYFVGREGTPNELVAPRGRDPPDVNWSAANDSRERQKWKRVYKCPACRTKSIEVTFDPASSSLGHRCMIAGCAFPGGRLPVYVIDLEIYRHIPAVIVGTIDKLASLGNQRKMSLLLGQVNGRCSVHGYYNAKCTQKGCNDRAVLIPGTPPGISPPSLFVQDELHLLKEGLGTFDGHYETFLQTLISDGGVHPEASVIASSATIEAFERQIYHLYGRKARVFPGPGPQLGESFYASTLRSSQRMFVGIIPHNKTLFNAILEMIEFYHSELARLSRLAPGSANPFSGSLEPGSNEWTSLLDPYIVRLAYFSTLRELDSVKTDLDNAVNSDLQRVGIPQLRMVEMAGSTSTDDVTTTLELLEAGPGHAQLRPDTVLSTSMISHGVDIGRLNCIFFYGMPRQTAEYIQASSRVGRTHFGLVFTCLKPERERDRSHFEYFEKYHEFLGQLVEPVAINRWARFSLQRTLPGMFMGVLLQRIANGQHRVNPDGYYICDVVKREISAGNIRADLFIPLLEKAYLVETATEVGPVQFRQEIASRVRYYLDQILAASSQTTFVSEALVPPPMISLRQVDEQIPIRLDDNGSRWADTR